MIRRRICNAVAEALWRNPLLAHRLRHHSVYTIANLVLTVAVVVTWGGAAVRWKLYHEALRIVAAYPDDMRWEVKRALWVPWAYFLRAARNSSTIPVSDVRFVEYLTWIVGGCAASVVGLMFLWACVPLVLLRRRRWDYPFGDEMRMLPVSPLQLYVARVEWPLIKVSLVLFLCWVAYLLPSRSPRTDLDLPGLGGMEPTVNAMFLFVIGGVWAVLFSFYRFCLVRWLCRQSFTYLVYLSAFLPWLLVLVLLPSLLWDPGYMTWRLWALYAAVALGLLAPVVAGIWVTPRLLAREDPPAMPRWAKLMKDM